jgi:hypothetical protein
MNNLIIAIFLGGCALAVTALFAPKCLKQKPKNNHRGLAGKIRRRARMLASSLDDKRERHIFPAPQDLDL